MPTSTSILLGETKALCVYRKISKSHKKERGQMRNGKPKRFLKKNVLFFLSDERVYLNRPDAFVPSAWHAILSDR